MGNCWIKPEEHENVFCPVDYSKVSLSVTLPSQCENPSFVSQIPGSNKSASSDSFSWNRMQSLVLQQQNLTEEHLSPNVLKIAGQVMEALKRHIRIFCCDIQDGTVEVPDDIYDKFKQSVGTKTLFQQHSSTTSTSEVISKKIILHVVTSLYIHDVILSHFRNEDNDLALDLLKQVAVSHALIGITPADFRMMDWFIIHYLIKNQVASDENINIFVIYLNTLSNYIVHFYNSQSIRAKTMQELLVEKENDRENKARENYRLMKRWRLQIEVFKGQDQFIEELLSGNQQKKTEDEESVDTLTLKRNDPIMKHFMRKIRKESITTSDSGKN